MNSTKTYVLGALLHEDFELLDLYGPLEMWGNLPHQVKIVTIAEKEGAVKSAQGPKTIADYSFDSHPKLDILLIPGGSGTFKEVGNKAMLNFLRTVIPQIPYVLTVCTGSFLLAKTGLIDGKNATSNKQLFEIGETINPKVNWIAKARWVEDGKFISSSGVSAGIDMSLAVIAKLFGQNVAEKLANETEYNWHTNADYDPFTSYLNQYPTKRFNEIKNMMMALQKI